MIPGYEVASVKTGVGFIAALLRPPPGGDWLICISRPVGPGRTWEGATWEGCASFPWELGQEAWNRLSQLETDTDLEALLREFGSEEQYEEFQFLGSWETGTTEEAP